MKGANNNKSSTHYSLLTTHYIIKPLKILLMALALSLGINPALGYVHSTIKPTHVLSPQQKFIHSMLPAIKEANAQVLQQRSRLLKSESQNVGTSERQWVVALAKQYGMKTFNPDSKKDWQDLTDRVDIIPPSLAIAQAINESDWGKSRFAREANNYYGQWCYRKGCGLVPKRRPKGRIYEVRKFANREQSVAAYIRNLNSHYTYHYLRSLRAELRKKHDLNGYELTAGLHNYSQRRGAYVKSLRAIIKRYDLGRYDK